MAGTLHEWHFKNGHVNENNIVRNGFTGAESIVLVAGPSLADDLSDEDISKLHTIGVIESAAISQNKQIQQLFEIGSKLPINVPGRTTVNVALSRIMIDGSSLMGVIGRSGDIHPGGGNDSPGFLTAGGSETGTGNESKFYLNLASTFFNNPLGLGMIFHDNQDDPLGMIYLEECLIRSHQLSIGAGQTIVMENVNLVATNIQHIDYGGDVQQPGQP